ncbi:hypothetical protein B0H15DRAFT_814527 [Mycena belliarum]|uniref:Uncharacterized protein n=1 Tax=Mycena belliarum TaxID=1033014 RepID=A0AAD6UKY6_9AGAR|nr:hypothetical protein B0H15DRAFT_814527 [Mycena belliae]
MACQPPTTPSFALLPLPPLTVECYHLLSSLPLFVFVAGSLAPPPHGRYIQPRYQIFPKTRRTPHGRYPGKRLT